MTKKTITVDNVEYDLDDLSTFAKEQIESLIFVDERIQELNNELAVADTARLGYARALKAEIENSANG